MHYASNCTKLTVDGLDRPDFRDYYLLHWTMDPVPPKRFFAALVVAFSLLRSVFSVPIVLDIFSRVPLRLLGPKLPFAV